MERNTNKIILLLLLVFCTQSGFAQIKNDKIGIEKITITLTEETLKLSSFIDVESVIVLDEVKDKYLGKVKKCCIINDKIGIFDFYGQGQIYNLDGEFINTLDLPAEYQTLKLASTTVNPFNETYNLFLLDNSDKLEYSTQGDFQASTTLPYRGIHHAFVSEDIIAILSGWWKNMYKGKEITDFLILVNKTGKVVASSLSDYPLKRSGIVNSEAFYYFNDSLRVFLHGCNTIYSIDKNGAKPRYQLDFQEKNLPPVFFELHKPNQFHEAITSSEYIGWYNRIYETESTLLISFLYKTRTCLSLYNKLNKTSKTVYQDNLINDIYSSKSVNMRGSYDDGILIVAYPSDIDINQPASTSNNLIINTVKGIENLDKWSQPIILLCKF